MREAAAGNTPSERFDSRGLVPITKGNGGRRGSMVQWGVEQGGVACPLYDGHRKLLPDVRHSQNTLVLRWLGEVVSVELNRSWSFCVRRIRAKPHRQETVIFKRYTPLRGVYEPRAPST